MTGRKSVAPKGYICEVWDLMFLDFSLTEGKVYTESTLTKKL